MPDLGEGVAEGEIVKWLVNEGDSINEDQPMVEVMTDKATVQIPSPTTGKVGKIMSKEGQAVKVGDVLVTFDEAGGSTAQVQKANISQATPSSAVQQNAAPIRTPGVGVVATPATRKLARDLNVNIESIPGSGPSGRITEEDIRKAANSAGYKAVFSERPALQPPFQQPQTQVVRPQSVPMRQTTSAKFQLEREEHVPIHGIRKRILGKDGKIRPHRRSCNSR